MTTAGLTPRPGTVTGPAELTRTAREFRLLTGPERWPAAVAVDALLRSGGDFAQPLPERR